MKTIVSVDNSTRKSEFKTKHFFGICSKIKFKFESKSFSTLGLKPINHYIRQKNMEITTKVKVHIKCDYID